MLKLNFFSILIIAFVVNYSQQDNEQLYQIKCNGCQATKPVQNFDMNRFINPGKWYLLQVYNFGEGQRNLDCSTDNFVQNGTNIEYTGLYAYNNGSVLAVPNRFPVDQFKSGEVQYSGVDLQVIDTDYNNYAIWHACYYSSSPSSTYERVVTATRNLVVKAKYVAYMNNVIANRLGLDPSLMPLMNRTLCQYI